MNYLSKIFGAQENILKHLLTTYFAYNSFTLEIFSFFLWVFQILLRNYNWLWRLCQQLLRSDFHPSNSSRQKQFRRLLKFWNEKQFQQIWIPGIRQEYFHIWSICLFLSLCWRLAVSIMILFILGNLQNQLVFQHVNISFIERNTFFDPKQRQKHFLYVSHTVNSWHWNHFEIDLHSFHSVKWSAWKLFEKKTLN